MRDRQQLKEDCVMDTSLVESISEAMDRVKDSQERFQFESKKELINVILDNIAYEFEENENLDLKREVNRFF